MQEIEYNRDKAVTYAHKWAYERNSKYYSFDQLGGDCTNFASQVLFAGCGVMNHSKGTGWYYNSANDRSPSWSGVEFLYNFLVKNEGAGPYSTKTEVEEILPGDIIQLKFGKDTFAHSLVVVNAGSPAEISNIYVATHTFNSDNRPLSSYTWTDIRFMHILGARKW